MSWFTLRSLGVTVLASVVTLPAPGAALAKTEIYWWHALQATLGERVNEIAAKFNASQNEYEVKAIFKGSYPETLNAAIAAYRAKQAPHVVQVYEVGTQTMLSSTAIYPVFQLMKDNNIAIDWNDLVGPVKTYYSSGGNLYSMAFNSSTPILYYNKDLFKKAGLDPNTPPKNFADILADAQKITALGNGVTGFDIAGSCGGCGVYTLFPYAWAAGVDILPDHGKRVDINNDTFKQIFGLYRQLTADKLVASSDKTQDGSTWPNNFLGGKVGMLALGSPIVGALNSQKIFTPAAHAYGNSV